MNTTFQFGDIEYKAELRDRSLRAGSNAYYAKTRAYVWDAGERRNPTKEFKALADYIGAPSVYTVKGEWPALDKAFNKMNREIVAAKREVLVAALAALEITDLGKASFSKNAGCQCGCSPGFIFSESIAKDLFIEKAGKAKSK